MTQGFGVGYFQGDSARKTTRSACAKNEHMHRD
jgi:hypothetical protein